MSDFNPRERFDLDPEKWHVVSELVRLPDFQGEPIRIRRFHDGTFDTKEEADALVGELYHNSGGELNVWAVPPLAIQEEHERKRREAWEEEERRRRERLGSDDLPF